MMGCSFSSDPIREIVAKTMQPPGFPVKFSEISAKFEFSSVCAAGWDIGRMIALGEGWVVRRHEIDYLMPLKPGETATMRTWVETAERASSERQYELFRASDGKMVSSGRTVWVWINYKTGRPARIPDAVIKDFANWEPAVKSS